MERFVVFCVPQLTGTGPTGHVIEYAEGSAYECAKELLRRCSPEELFRLKRDEILPIQREVASRRAAEAAGYDLGRAPAADMHAACESDEDGDPIDEPTPVVEVEPLEVVREPREEN